MKYEKPCLVLSVKKELTVNLKIWVFLSMYLLKQGQNLW